MYTRLAANTLAYSLAKWAKDNERYNFWVSGIPDNCYISYS